MRTPGSRASSTRSTGQDIFTHIEEFQDFFVNAFYDGNGILLFGEGLPAGFTLDGQAWDFLSGAIDIVAHELTHGVTEFTSNLIYRDESGALNESFSDMMGTGVEFFFQQPGDGLALRADYLIGEDAIRPGGLRSMSDPASKGDPDHYSKRFLGHRRQRRRAHQLGDSEPGLLSGDRRRHQPDLRAERPRGRRRATGIRSKKCSTGR